MFILDIPTDPHVENKTSDRISMDHLSIVQSVNAFF